MNFKWARDIPSFQQLSSHNQKILLQHSWSQLLVLSLAQLPGTLEQFEAFHYLMTNKRMEWRSITQIFLKSKPFRPP